jgi:hypothetical protein
MGKLEVRSKNWVGMVRVVTVVGWAWLLCGRGRVVGRAAAAAGSHGDLWKGRRRMKFEGWNWEASRHADDCLCGRD